MRLNNCKSCHGQGVLPEPERICPECKALVSRDRDTPESYRQSMEIRQRFGLEPKTASAVPAQSPALSALAQAHKTIAAWGNDLQDEDLAIAASKAAEVLMRCLFKHEAKALAELLASERAAAKREERERLLRGVDALMIRMVEDALAVQCNPPIDAPSSKPIVAGITALRNAHGLLQALFAERSDTDGAPER